MRTLVATTLALCLAGTAFAQTTVEQDTAPIGENSAMDLNTDRGFAARDTNRDGMIDADEYRAGELRRYDADGDGALNDEERAAFEANEDKDGILQN